MPMPSIERVWLSDLKIAALKPPYDPEQSPKAASATQLSPKYARDQIPSQAPVEGPAPTAARPKPYERLAADKPGEELAPDAGIWQLYVEEATEHDTELVKQKNDNLDVMLLFAALFSAILTAFLIESKNLLQEDSGDLTVTLLLAIAQSQQRLEQGSPQVQPPIERPNFSPPGSARWINGLWFTALCLSLAAALIAMLAKEWLSAFTAARSRSAQVYAHLHQRRLTGMYKWKALHIIDLLPSLLHLSLLLFSLGFAVYLWTLDMGIAVAGIVVIAAALVFYLGTAIAGAIYESCPFVTQVSKYMRAALRLFYPKPNNLPRSTRQTDVDGIAEPLHEDLRALLWLIEHATDPVISDCACQALAGLPIPRIQPVDSAVDESFMFGNSDHTSQKAQLIGFSLIWRAILRIQRLMSAHNSRSTLYNRYRLMVSLFDHTRVRIFEANTRQHRDLKACQGLNVARYSSALPALVQHLVTSTVAISVARKKENEIGADTFHGFAQAAFRAIDCTWNDDYPEFSLDAYALLTAAELRLTEVVTRFYHSKLAEPAVSHHIRLPMRLPPLESAATESLDTTPDHSPSIHIELEGVVPLHDLRARHSRAMARASIILSVYNEGRALINRHPLTYLLDSIRTSSQCEILNPLNRIGTVWPQSAGVDTLPEFRITIAGTGANRKLPPLNAGDEDGLLSALVVVLSSPGIEGATEVETAAVRALATNGPILIQQWLSAMSAYSVDLLNRDISDRVLAIWPAVPNQSYIPYLPNRTVEQLLSVATFALSQVDCQYMSDLVEMMINALFSRASMESGRASLHFIGDDSAELVELFLRLMDQSSSKISQAARGQYLRLLLIKKFKGSLLSCRCITPQSLLNIISLIASSPGYPSEVQSIQAGLMPWLPGYRNGRVSYIVGFVRQVDGFMSLLKIATIPEYTMATIDFIAEVIKVAVRNSILYRKDPDEQLALDATPGLLATVQLVIQTTTSKTEDGERLVSCMRNTIYLLSRFDSAELELPTIRSGIDTISEALEPVCKLYAQAAEVWAEWKEFPSYAPVGGYYLGGLSWLFDSSSAENKSG